LLALEDLFSTIRLQAARFFLKMKSSFYDSIGHKRYKNMKLEIETFFTKK